jgi:hypothetical protein
MPRRPTSPQVATLERIRLGYPPNATPDECRRISPLPVATFDSAVTGEIVQCHRVVHTSAQLGRTELFRVSPDGFATQH